MPKATADTISFDSKQAPQQINSTVSNGNRVTTLPTQENRIFKLSNDKRQGTVSIDVEEDVIDPASGMQRRMRLLRGAQSIWLDEQPPLVFPKSYVDKNTLTLDFHKGVMIVPIHEPLKIKAAEITNSNMSVRKAAGASAKHKPFYFYEWNPAEQNRKGLEDQNNIIKALNLASSTPIEEIIPHAQYLGIQFSDEMGVPFDDDAIRMAYSRKAMEDAPKFLSSIHSPVVKMSHMVRKAIDKGFIDLGKQPGAAYWTDGGFISTLPQGRDSVEYLIEYAMLHGEPNAMFANLLRELVT